MENINTINSAIVLFDFPQIYPAMEETLGNAVSREDTIIKKILAAIKWCVEKIKELIRRIINQFGRLFNKNKPTSEIKDETITAYKNAVSKKSMLAASKAAAKNDDFGDGEAADISNIPGLSTTPNSTNTEDKKDDTDSNKSSSPEVDQKHVDLIVRTISSACQNIEKTIIKTSANFVTDIDALTKSVMAINSVNNTFLSKLSHNNKPDASLVESLNSLNKRNTEELAKFNDLGNKIDKYKKAIGEEINGIINNAVKRCNEKELPLVRKNLSISASRMYMSIFSSSAFKQKYTLLKSECEKIQSFSDKANNFAIKFSKSPTDKTATDLCQQINLSCRSNVQMVSNSIRVINMSMTPPQFK